MTDINISRVGGKPLTRKDLTRGLTASSWYFGNTIYDPEPFDILFEYSVPEDHKADIHGITVTSTEHALIGIIVDNSSIHPFNIAPGLTTKLFNSRLDYALDNIKVLLGKKSGLTSSNFYKIGLLLNTHSEKIPVVIEDFDRMPSKKIYQDLEIYNAYVSDSYLVVTPEGVNGGKLSFSKQIDYYTPCIIECKIKMEDINSQKIEIDFIADKADYFPAEIGGTIFKLLKYPYDNNYYISMMDGYIGDIMIPVNLPDEFIIKFLMGNNYFTAKINYDIVATGEYTYNMYDNFGIKIVNYPVSTTPLYVDYVKLYMLYDDNTKYRRFTKAPI